MNSEYLNQAKSRFLDGIKFFNEENYELAEKNFLKSLDLAPQRLSVISNLIKIYIDLALKIWKPEEIGFSDLIEKEKDKGFTSWEFFLKQAIKNAA